MHILLSKCRDCIQSGNHCKSQMSQFQTTRFCDFCIENCIIVSPCLLFTLISRTLFSDSSDTSDVLQYRPEVFPCWSHISVWFYIGSRWGQQRFSCRFKHQNSSILQHLMQFKKSLLQCENNVDTLFIEMFIVLLLFDSM